jgi:predicted RNase H-like HicB family nuclease
VESKRFTARTAAELWYVILAEDGGRPTWYTSAMQSTFTAVIERDADTGMLVGHVPGFPGAHSQGQTLDELNRNLREVIEMLLEDGEPVIEGEFVGTQLVTVG